MLSSVHTTIGNAIVQYRYPYIFSFILVLYIFFISFKDSIYLSNIKAIMLWIFFCIVCFLSSIFSFDVFYSLNELFFVVISIFLVFVIANHKYFQENIFWSVVRLVLWVSFIVSIVGIYGTLLGNYVKLEGVGGKEFHFLGTTFQIVVHGIDGVPRFGSIIGETPNNLAMINMIAVIFCIGYYFKFRKNYVFLYSVLIINILLLLLSFSRLSILATILGVIFFFSLVSENKMSLFRKLLVFGIFAVSLVVILELSYDLVEILIEKTKNKGLTNRDSIWLLAMEYFYENPILGIGYGLSKEYVLERNGLPYSHLHNLYLKLLVETGILGLFSFIVFCGYILAAGLKKVKKQNDIELYVALTIFVVFLFHSLGELTILSKTYRTMLWFFMVAFILKPKKALT